MTTTEAPDVVQVEVHHKLLRNIAKEMAITLMRTSGSPVVTEAKDFSTCILDADGEQLAFSGHVTFHISTAVYGVRAVLERTPLEDIHPGDGFVCNDPHTSGAIHQGDIGIVMPFFHDGDLVGWGYVNEHVLDIGGGAVSGFAPAAFDSFSEALAFPGVRLVRNGRIDPQWEAFLSANVRTPQTVLNDIRSMVAANNAGQRRIAALVDELGVSRFQELGEAGKDLSEQAVRRIVGALPDGTYEAVDWVEYDARGTDDLHEVRTRMIVARDSLTLQFRGGPQTDSFINGAEPAVVGQAWSTLIAQLIHDVPLNAGIWRAVEFDLGPKGTIVNSAPPAPVSQSHMETGMRVNKLLTDVLSQACSLSDDPTIAGRVAGQPAQNMSFFTAYGTDRRSGAPVVAFPMSVGMSSGGPALTVGDGLEVYAGQCMSGCDMPDAEIEETTQPGIVLWRRVAADTGGAGVYRGGLGVDTALAILHCDRMTGGAYTNTSRVPPGGSAGGYPGAAGAWNLVRGSNVTDLLDAQVLPTSESLDGDRPELPAKLGSLVLDRGDVFTVVNGGGGGVGDPLLRDPAAVARDVTDGYVSAAAARDVYAVVLDDEGGVALPGTEQARAAARAARLGGDPTRRPTPGLTSFAPLRVVDGRWSCRACDQDLGSVTVNWRAAAVVVETEVSERYRTLHSQVRARRDATPVVVRENFCPACATALQIDVALQGDDPAPAPRPGVIDPYPAEVTAG